MYWGTTDPQTLHALGHTTYVHRHAHSEIITIIKLIHASSPQLSHIVKIF